MKLFNGLKRHARYKFTLVSGESFTAIFQQYLPDGTLLVSGNAFNFPGADTVGQVNPDAIAIAWQVKGA